MNPSGHAALTGLCRPLQLGASVGHPLGGTGSIGPFVTLADGGVGFVSASYVLAPTRSRRGDMIHQPGPGDLDVATGRTRAAELAVLPPTDLPWVAAARLLPEVGMLGNAASAGLGAAAAPIGPPGPGPAIELGTAVCAIGRSGLRHGRITAQDITGLAIKGDNARRMPVPLDQALEVEGTEGPFSLAGDAGALVFATTDRTAIGIIVASSANHSYLLPLALVLDALGVGYR